MNQNQFCKTLCLLCSIMLLQASVQAAAPALTLDYPRGGEVFVAGTTQRIALGPKIKYKSVKVELSRDGGGQFFELGTITVVKKVVPSLTFTVSGPPSRNCVVRVSGPGATDQSVTSGTFSILTVDTNGLVEIGDGTVTTPKIAPGAVTNPKIADLAVSAEKISSGQASSGFVLTADGSGNTSFQPLSVPDNTVTSAMLVDGEIVNADISAAANIARSKLAAGSPDHVVINDAAGKFSSEAQLSVSRGGTGANIFPARSVLVGNGSSSVSATNSPTAGQVLLASGSGTPTFTTITGDVSISSGGVATLTGLNFADGLKINGKTIFVQDGTPTATATNDLWWETDSSILWFWDGSRWLSQQLHTYNGVVVAATVNVELGEFTPEITSGALYNLFLVDFCAATTVASPNSAASYWDVSISRRIADTGDTGTTLATISTRTDAANQFVCGDANHKQSLNQVLDLTGTNTRLLRMFATKVGNPGYLVATSVLTYRWIHP